MRKNTRVIIFISGVLLLAFGMLGLKEDELVRDWIFLPRFFGT